MSWIGSLAAKTETLLNKVDQVAGHALHTPEKNETFNQIPMTQEQLQAKFSKDSKHLSLNNLTSESYILKKSNSSTKLSKMDSKKDPDSELFEFLNDSKVPLTNTSQPAQASTIAQPTAETKTQTPPKDRQINNKISTENTLKSSSSTLTDDSFLVRENQLLKDEIQSLNRELMSIASRGKSTLDEFTKASGRLEAERRQVAQREATIRELREREIDLTTAMQAKDSQLSVLRVRLEEADLDVKGKSKTIEHFQTEKNSILEDHSVSTGVQSHALDSLQERLKELERALKSEQDKSQQLEGENRTLMAGLEQEKGSHATALASSQRKLTAEKAKTSDILNQLKLMRSQADLSKHDLAQYKEKATRILQSKEKLIGKLKESVGAGFDGSGASEPIQVTEMESLRTENDMLREDLTAAQLSLETLKAEFADLEMQSEHETLTMAEQVSTVEEGVVAERMKREEVEADLARKTHELKYMQEEYLTQKSKLQGRVHEREADIQKLRTQLTTKSLNATSTEELEGRLHALTESLIQKQTHLEAISSERNSLGLQLERVEKQYREAEFIAMRHSSSTINIHNDDEDVRVRFHNLMHESPFDGNVTRNVKKAANSIDRFSVRLGVFLRRYPIARLFIILYMLLLHIWVMVVLLTYEPEMHHADFTFPHAP